MMRIFEVLLESLYQAMTVKIQIYIIYYDCLLFVGLNVYSRLKVGNIITLKIIINVYTVIKKINYTEITKYITCITLTNVQ